jgi:hypothetical protein
MSTGPDRFDLLATNRRLPPADVARGDSEYSQAQAACVDERGYSLP